MTSDRQSRSARIALEANRLGEPLKGLRVPQEVVSQIVTTLRNDQQHSVDKVSAERSRLEARLTGIRNRMDGAYTDKLDGKKSPRISGNAGWPIGEGKKSRSRWLFKD